MKQWLLEYLKKSTLGWSFFIEKFAFYMFYFVDFYVIPLFNITLIMPVLRGLKDKLEVTRNKCIRFCLKWQCAEHVSNEHFHKLNWLPTNQRFKQCVTSTVFKFVQNKFPSYENEVFRPAENIRINKRNSFLKLNHPFRKTSTGQRACLILDLLFGTDFQTFWRKSNIWILSKVRWDTTIWMISLI